MRDSESDNYLGAKVDQYILRKKIGEGNIGKVYRAVNDELDVVLACKVIPDKSLRDGWKRELEKVVKLTGIESVVQYRAHGTATDLKDRPFIWVLMEYIDGVNLTDYIERNEPPLDMAFIELVARRVLEVLHACQAVGIQHGDLHEGNILISNPDKRIVGKQPRVYVSDFGYGGSHNEVEPKNDFRQLFSVISSMLRRLDPAALNARDRIMFTKMCGFFRHLLEIEASQGEYVGSPEKLLGELSSLSQQAESEAAAAVSSGVLPTAVGDYLNAESLGNRIEEWKALFVKDFLGARDLLSQNNTILTGARGCGKTMAFRRVTLFMDSLIGEPSGVEGSEHFVGFYFNCRDLIETFPFIPKVLKESAQLQILHLFHLGWLAEITNALALTSASALESFDWLDNFLIRNGYGKYKPLAKGADILDHVRAFLEDEKERCRRTKLGSMGELDNWPFARADLLDSLQVEMENNLTLFKGRPLFFFLDDYTTPLVASHVQKLLNAIIFKRRSKIFFKVSTEASNSFERSDSRGKQLELHQDFELIDLATESLHATSEIKIALLEQVFRPRLERDPNLRGRSISLSHLLGHSSYSNNELARVMRTKKIHKRVLYHGIEAFEGMWTSDIRIMIQILTQMLRQSVNELVKNNFEVSSKIQDRIYRNAGGEFLDFAVSAEDPNQKDLGSADEESDYGKQLFDIVQSFINTSRYEMIERPEIKNQRKKNPRQAFRLEIIDELRLTPELQSYYEGLVRWHIFMQDWRGKSVRGVLTQRLYLNRVLIPYAKLTFSTKDSLQMTNKQFSVLLEHPKRFLDFWKKRHLDHQGPRLTEYNN